MAQESKPATQSGRELTQTEKMQAGRKAKAGNRASSADLSTSAKYALRMLAQARSGAKIVADQVRAGYSPDPEVIKAAALLASAASAAMLE